MTVRDVAPTGAPTWIDLWTSDVEGSRAFYPAVFGWEALPADPDFGGYFQFAHNGHPVAGAMGDMGPMKANDTWKIYFQTPDIRRSAAAVTTNGGVLHFPPEPVGDLGLQCVFSDPSGAVAGAWQPLGFQGFAEVEAPGAPSWFELHTRDHAGSVAFYTAVFEWRVDSVSDTDAFRYATVRDADGGDTGVAGLMDNRADIAESEPAFWTIYFEAADVDATIATATSLGATVVEPAQDTPYGRLAVLADPAGARFSLRNTPI
ncbi:MAG: VOC family protein [Actinobacteria bacterium]|nr:VOC family protein [Actinomycetota bacterium]